MIEIENLTKKFGDLQVLKGVNLTIKKGEVISIVGSSGAGKTTLLQLIGTLDTPTGGAIRFNGVDLGRLSSKALADFRNRHIGFVFQSVALIPVMTAYENVEFALRLAGSKGDNRKRVEECLKLVGLGARMTHMPQELSGGEQQRVAIARAMAHKPRVIFADEPTAELDTNTGLQVIKIFKELAAADGITFVMTTHDTGLMEFGDRVYELKDGELVNE